METPVLVTVNQLVARNEALTEGGVRYDIFNAKTNGLEECGAIIRWGRKVMINEPVYLNHIINSGGGHE